MSTGTPPHRFEDFQDEVRTHIEFETSRLIAQGMAPEEARAAARRSFGNSTAVLERLYEGTRLMWIRQLGGDLRYALRGFRRSPGFTAVAVLTLALGIGVNATIFSMLSTAFLRPLPVPHADRVVVLSRGGEPFVSVPDYIDFRDHAATFEALAIANLTESSLDVNGRSNAIGAEPVSGNYAQALGVATALGRWFSTDDEPSAVIRYDIWQRTFGGDPGVLGKTVRSESSRYTIVGVAPRGFTGVFGLIPTGMWVPVGTWVRQYPGLLRDMTDRNRPHFMAVGLLKPGATPARAAAEVNVIHRHAHESDPPSAPRLQPIAVERAAGFLNATARRQAAPVMVLLVVLVGLVLMIACANVGNLMLARGVAREREIAVRLAIGASRWRLTRQLLAESALLAVFGGAAGMLVGWASNGVVKATLQAVFPVEHMQLTLDLDHRAIALTAALSALTVLIFGLFPAHQATRFELLPGLRGDAAAPSRVRLRRISLVAQVAVSVILIFCAASFLSTLGRLAQTDPGFLLEKRLYADVFTPRVDFTETQGRRFYDRLVARLQALPGVRSIGSADVLPLVPLSRGCVSIAGRSEPVRHDEQLVDAGYFETMRVPIVAGRSFDGRDTPAAPRVAIVSQALAAQLWPHDDAVGRTLLLGCDGRESLQVAGIARDTNVRALGEPPQPHLYLPMSQHFAAHRHIVIETGRDPASMVPVVTRAILAENKNASLYEVRTLADFVHSSFWQVRFVSGLLAAMGLLGLTLAAVGLYGATAYRVNTRAKEMAIRMALGARAGSVFAIVVREALWLTLAGVVFGLALSYPLGRVLARMVVGVKAGDPLAFAGTALVWIAVAVAGASLPARRAARLDPMKTLRQE
jgi:predicted permease